MSPKENFQRKAPAVMRRLMAEFELSATDAAAILGNLGHESEGLATLQEISPTVKGSAGGYGWGQWTGPRRRTFMAWCKKSQLDPASDEANLGYLIQELKTTEGGAIPAVKKASGLYNKVVAFEAHFERAGIKHYASREQWAEIAQAAYNAAGGAQAAPVAPRPAPRPQQAATGSAALVEAVQRALISKGYKEVGKPDGDMGSKTRGAILSFEADQGRELTGTPTAEVLAAILASEPRPISEERATGKPQGHPVLQDSNMLRTIGGVLGGTGLLSAADPVVDNIEHGAGLASRLKEAVMPFLGMWPLLAIIAGVAIFWLAMRSRKAVVEDFRTGRLNQ